MALNYLKIVVLFVTITLNAQTGIGTISPDANTVLDVSSTDKGVLIPRLQLDDLNTATPLTTAVADGTLIYSEGGLQVDGFYYWKTNKWLSFESKVIKFYTVNNSGGNTTTPHQIPADTSRFTTHDGNWASSFVLPNATDSNNANRLNEVISFIRMSTFGTTIVTTNTDMTSNISLVRDQSASFMFDGSKWVLIKISN